MTRNPLVLPQFMDYDEVKLVSCPVGVDGSGSAIRLDVMDPSHFGRPFLPASGAPLRWLATTPLPDPAALRELYPFHGGALVSPRVRRLIEEHGAAQVEFIPLRIAWEGSGEPIADWWFANVFHWRDVFDFGRSKLEYTEFDEEPGPWQARSAEFGSAAVTEIHELAATEAAFEGGLFLARAPTETIWARVFIGLGLAEAINEGVPPERRVHFEEFRLAGRPQPPSMPSFGPPRRRWRWLPW